MGKDKRGLDFISQTDQILRNKHEAKEPENEHHCFAFFPNWETQRDSLLALTELFHAGVTLVKMQGATPSSASGSDSYHPVCCKRINGK